MSNLVASDVITERDAALPPLKIGYARAGAAEILRETNVLAAIGFDGVGKGGVDDPRWLSVGLDAVGDSAIEVWRASGPVRSGRDGRVRWSHDEDYGFFAIEVEEVAGDISAAAEAAYREIVPLIHASATPHVLRLWNYFDAINEGDGDDERYRRFCVGRARGMADVWQDRYPAATAIGRRDGVRVLQVYALAARIAGAPVENPRQVNAWRYPREYGPTPPTFARGMTTPAGQLLISGTAAVVGSASRHHEDVGAQLDETLTNVESLIRTAGTNGAKAPGHGSLLKVYVRDANDAPLVVAKLAEAMQDADGILVLRGDICRRELLVEIDGVHT
ncbi:MAG TPA: pteridine-dependent deoxygenase [Rhodanobacteraceae bacterium]|nr:pteridine-dependent deoxygenase [Rhodanobacteraceae bacterium]